MRKPKCRCNIITCRIFDISGDKESFLLEVKGILRELGKLSISVLFTHVLERFLLKKVNNHFKLALRR